jgi:hypothetical protein
MVAMVASMRQQSACVVCISMLCGALVDERRTNAEGLGKVTDEDAVPKDVGLLAEE